MKEKQKEAMQYLGYLEYIVKDRADDPSGTFVCKLQEYRKILSQFSPQIDEENTRKELKQACNAFESGDYEALEQLRKPRLLDGRQMVDIGLRAVVETMISLWGKDHDQLTQAQALQLHTIYRIADAVDIFDSSVMDCVHLFLENQADTAGEGYKAVSAWMKKKYAWDDMLLAESQDYIKQILVCIHTEPYKYYALMANDRTPSGILESEWEELKKEAFVDYRPRGVGVNLMSALICLCDYKAFCGLGKRYPCDSGVQEALNGLSPIYLDQYRARKLEVWHMECITAQRRYVAQRAKPQQQIGYTEYAAQECNTPQPVQQQQQASYQEDSL